MNGFAHSSIGFGVGFAIAETSGATPFQTVLLIGAGSLSALVPDLDINGKLANKMTLPHQFLKTITTLAGCLVIYLTLTHTIGIEMWQGIGLGVALVGTAQWISKRFMLSITGMLIIAAGLFLSKLWLTLFGGYVLIASFLSHRTYTHSLLGLGAFSCIAWLFSRDVGIHDLFLACSLGYASHLLADMKWLPSNKRGIKLFLPLSKRSF